MPSNAPAAFTLDSRVTFPSRGSSYKKNGPALSGTARCLAERRYFVEPELPLLLGELLDPLLLGALLDPLLLGVELEPLLLEPLLLGGVALEPLLLGEELEPLLLGVLDELPPVAPLLEPDFLKCASHSARDTCPSLSLSTVENSGVELDAPLELLPLDMPLDELPLELGVEELLLGDEELPPLEELLGLDELPLDPLELLPLALGEDLSLLELPLALGEDLSVLELELCAMDTLASAKSAAAVAVVISFNFIWYFLLQESGGKDCVAIPCNARAYGVPNRGSFGVTSPPSGVALAGSMTLGRPAGCGSPVAASLAFAAASCCAFSSCSLPACFA